MIQLSEVPYTSFSLVCPLVWFWKKPIVVFGSDRISSFKMFGTRVVFVK